MCLGSDGPGGQAVHPPSEAAHRVDLIPVSGVGKVEGEEKIGGNAVEGMTCRDMTDDKMIFEAGKMS